MVSVAVDLTGARVLVVGGSSGIGRSTAIAAARAGASIVVVGRRAENLAEVVTTAGSGTAIVADVRDAGRCADLVAEAVDAMGGLDAVIYSTGVSPLAPLDSVDAETWHDVIATNTIAPALVAQAALGSLSPDGIVLFVSSITVGSGHFGLAPYGASKAALDRTVKAWRMEHPERRFVCLAVGDTLGTDFARSFDLETAGALFPKWLAAGVLYENQMESDDVGLAVAELVAMLLAHPGIAVPELMMVPPGPMKSGSVDDIIAGISDLQEAQETEV